MIFTPYHCLYVQNQWLLKQLQERLRVYTIGTWVNSDTMSNQTIRSSGLTHKELKV